MPTIHRTSPGSRVLDLTKRLAEEYDAVPLPDVRESVREAAELVEASKTGTTEKLTLIERIARADLNDQVAARRG